VQEQEVPEVDEEVGEDLPECPDHRPRSFKRGKPRSIFLPRFTNNLLILYLTDALRFGVICNSCCIIPCLPFLPYPYYLGIHSPEMLSLLRLVEVG
jgi:hypothetical protein